jgi:hypothetical protein
MKTLPVTIDRTGKFLTWFSGSTSSAGLAQAHGCLEGNRSAFQAGNSWRLLPISQPKPGELQTRTDQPVLRSNCRREFELLKKVTGSVLVRSTGSRVQPDRRMRVDQRRSDAAAFRDLHRGRKFPRVPPPPDDANTHTRRQPQPEAKKPPPAPLSLVLSSQPSRKKLYKPADSM